MTQTPASHFYIILVGLSGAARRRFSHVSYQDARTVSSPSFPPLILSYPPTVLVSYSASHHMGDSLSVFVQSFPPRSIWGVNDFLTGEVTLVTATFSESSICACACMFNLFCFVGGNAGVGLETINVRYRTYTPLTDSQACSLTFISPLCTTRKSTSQGEALDERGERRAEERDGQAVYFCSSNFQTPLPSVTLRNSSSRMFRFAFFCTVHGESRNIAVFRKKRQLHVLVTNV